MLVQVSDFDLNRPSTDRVFRLRVDLSAVEMLSCGTVPKIILPARPDYWYYFLFGQLTKTTAVVFTGTGSNMVVQWNASTPISGIAIPDTFLGTAAAGARMSIPGTTNQETSNAAASIGGKTVIFTRQSGTDLTGTGAPCTLLLYYRLIPSLL